MSMWSQFLLNESFSEVMQLLSQFHDYSLAIISGILVFVGVASVSLVFNSLISDALIITMVELVWTVIPMIILVFLAIPSLHILYLLDENSPYLTLKVVGHQWYWSYEVPELDLDFDSYMSSECVSGEYRLVDVDHRVVLPAQKDVRALITSGDVIHSWALPSLGLKADAVPGRLNQLSFSVMRPSLMYGQCSEICGANHSFMPITIESIMTSKFLEWQSRLCVGKMSDCKPDLEH